MPDFAVSLGALLGELGSEPSGMSNTEDPQTHYQLGVASDPVVLARARVLQP